jgi:ribosome-associated translation inhibitor RaiA
VNVVFHAHHATVSDALQRRAETNVRKLAERLPRAVDATVRFVEDGPARRVEIELRAAPHRHLVAAGTNRLYDVALSEAVTALEAQVERERAARERRRRAAVRGVVAADGRAFGGDGAYAAGEIEAELDATGAAELSAGERPAGSPGAGALEA